MPECLRSRDRGADAAYLPHEIEALEAYVHGGGGLFLAIDPRARTNLYALAGWGIRFGDDAIIDRAALFARATSPITDDYASTHPITEPFVEPTLFPMARSLLAEGASGSASDPNGRGVLGGAEPRPRGRPGASSSTTSTSRGRYRSPSRERRVGALLRTVRTGAPTGAGRAPRRARGLGLRVERVPRRCATRTSS